MTATIRECASSRAPRRRVSQRQDPNLQEFALRAIVQASAERRRRRRAIITAPVCVRVPNSLGSLEEVCTTLDVSRDGLLFLTHRPRYSKSQRVDVLFPYSNGPSGVEFGQAADVVRVMERRGGFYAVAVQFLSAEEGPRSSRRNAPAKSPAANGGREAATPPVPSFNPLVLGVESDERVARIMRQTLEREGYAVKVVPTAGEALEILRTVVPAVFIAEMEAEDIPGQDFCLMLKRDERLDRVPVILFTRSARPSDYWVSHRMGAAICMTKPFQPRQLLHVVRLVAPVSISG